METALLPPTVYVPIVVALLGLVGSMGVTLTSHIAKLNRRQDAFEHRDRLSWLYIRSLIDHAYRHNATPLPDPPEGWLEPIEGNTK